MVLKAKNELKQYLISINLIYAKYREDLWAEEVNSAAAWKTQYTPGHKSC